MPRKKPSLGIRKTESFLRPSYKKLSSAEKQKLSLEMENRFDRNSQRSGKIYGEMRDFTKKVFDPSPRISKRQAQTKLRKIKTSYGEYGKQLQGFFEFCSKHFESFNPTRASASKSQNNIEVQAHKAFRYYEFLGSRLASLEERVKKM